MGTNYKGNSDNFVDSKYLYDTLKDFKSITDSSYGSKKTEHSHTNKESILDKFGKNADGDLTFDGNIVNNGSTAITNHIADNDIHVSATFKTNTNTHISNSNIHMSAAEKSKLNSAYQKPSSGIPKTDLASGLQTEIDAKVKKTDIYDDTTKKIKESLMDYSGVDHELIKNIGTMSHDEIEQILDNHISNTVIHQTQSLGQLIVTGDDFLVGTFSNCNYNVETGYIELDQVVTTDPIEYITEEATYVSKVLNTGIENCPYVTFSWLGKYNTNYTNIVAYIRYGSTSDIDETWTDWEEVPYDKTITGAAQYCQAKIIFKTSNKYKNIILKNIIIYYGVDMASELVDARTDVNGKVHTTLKKHLDNIENNMPKPDEKLETDTDYTVPVKVDKNGKLFSMYVQIKIDSKTKHWIVEGVDTGIIAEGKTITSLEMDDFNNVIATFTDDTTVNLGQLHVDIQGNFLTEDGFGNLRYYNGHFQYYNKETSTWIDTSVSPDNVYVFKMIPQEMKKIIGVYDVDFGKYKLKFEEPDDTIVENQVFCVVDKIIIRRKLDSVPTSETDGDLVVEIPRKDFGKYKNSWFIDNELTPNTGEEYYYKAFPMSTTGFCNSSTSNETSILCKDYELYGFKLDQNESDPSKMITYLNDCDNKQFDSAYMNYTSDTFDYGDWKEAWFIKNLKPCMLKYDGTVDYELSKSDYTKMSDGITDSDVANTAYEGNAMVGFPKVYWKIVDNSNDTANIYFSDKQVDADFHCWSHIDNNGNEIDYCYMPIYNGSNVSSKLRSLSGRTPIASQTGTTEITYAKANNVGADIIWYTELFNDRMLVNLLLLLIGKSTDTKTVFGTGNNNSYSSTSSTGIKATGTMNTKGLFWGNKDNKTGVKVFGMEHWWGNQWRRIGGWINNKGTQMIKLTYGQNDGSTVDGYNTTGSGYISLSGSTPSGTSSGYISKMLINENGLILIVASGSSTTYYTNGLWFNNSQVDYAFVGGDSAYGSLVGALSSNLSRMVSHTGWAVGASVSCKPLAQKG